MMSEEANKALVRRYVEELINRGDIDVAEAIFAADFITHPPHGGALARSPQSFAQNVVQLRIAFPDWHARIEHVIAEGDMVADRVWITATHTGSVRGIPASGRPLAFAGIHHWRVADGKLAELWGRGRHPIMDAALGVP
ncbi:MAG: ester cyclase [Dehalococcoidia bacterium]